MHRRSRAALVFLLSTLLPLAQACGTGDSARRMNERFEVHAVLSPQGPIVVRFDTATGVLERSTLIGGRLWTPVGDAPEGEPGGAAGAGRYGFDFVSTQAIPLTLLRFDRQTGRVWRMAYGQDRGWAPYQSPGEPGAEQSAAATPPAPERPPRRPPAQVAAPQKRPAAKVPRKPTEAELQTFAKAIENQKLPDMMRVWSIEQLSAHGQEAALEPLLRVLDDPKEDVVRSAIRELAKLDEPHDPRIAAAIGRFRDDERESVRLTARNALDKLD